MSKYARKKKYFIENIVKHEKDVYGFLVNATEDRFLAEDLLQDTMEKAWAGLSQLKENEKARSWLFSIARNTTLSHFRAYAERDTFDEKWDSEDCVAIDTETSADDVLESLVNEFNVISMKEALKRLEGKYRRLIVLHYYQDMSLKEIAELFNEKYSTIRVALTRALYRLKEISTEIEKGGF